MGDKKGFTVIELLIVIILLVMILTVGLPVSYGMYETYRAASLGQEVMAFVSDVRRQTFLHSERKVLSSRDEYLFVNEEKKPFKGVNIHIPKPIIFYPNGTSSGGAIELRINDINQRLTVQAPLGELSLDRTGT